MNIKRRKSARLFSLLIRKCETKEMGGRRENNRGGASAGRGEGSERRSETVRLKKNGIEWEGFVVFCQTLKAEKKLK